MPADRPTRQNGSAIRTIRERTLVHGRPMTQRQLADMCGMSEGNLSLIETGKNHAQMSSLIRIAEALACPLSAIVRDPLAVSTTLTTASRNVA